MNRRGFLKGLASAIAVRKLAGAAPTPEAPRKVVGFKIVTEPDRAQGSDTVVEVEPIYSEAEDTP